MAKKRKKRGLIKRVVILRNGSMRTLQGKKITWSKISPYAKFTHEK